MVDKQFAERIRMVRQLLGLFRLERLVYVCVTLLSLALLFWCAIRLIASGSEPTVVMSVLGGSGGILYTTGRLLRMWSDALKVVAGVPGGGGDA